MKYIITEEGDIIIFSGLKLVHSDVAQKMGLTPISAGFLNVMGQVRCVGESATLNIGSRAQDAELIEAQLMI